MKSFTINLGRNHEIIENDVPTVRSGNADACVKGYFYNQLEGSTMSPSIYINAEVLKEYFSDLLGEEITELSSSNATGSDGASYVEITPAHMWKLPRLMVSADNRS